MDTARLTLNTKVINVCTYYCIAASHVNELNVVILYITYIKKNILVTELPKKIQ